MQANPYPKESEDHKIWQQGYLAGWNEAADIVRKVNAEATALKKFRRLVVLAFVPQNER